MNTANDQQVIPAGTNMVKVKAQRTFSKTVTAVVSGGFKEKDKRYQFRVDYRVMPRDRVKELQEEEDDYAFLDAVVYKAFIEFTDEDDNPLPDSEQRACLFNDPAFSTAMVSAYLNETVGKNSLKKR